METNDADLKQNVSKMKQDLINIAKTYEYHEISEIKRGNQQYLEVKISLKLNN